ncbi:hypothetical protein CBM2586_A50598 [Cupriavidus phytorum]|uniref:Uncharacterized protein n=1 Tax=Cupriavidus taiwanensis TaxID=164546 RepID=A0A375C3W8_9BURK|nr:hypothetical protein CBM2586_A50598 [Cupriavidus taiwanensis]
MPAGRRARRGGHFLPFPPFRHPRNPPFVNHITFPPRPGPARPPSGGIIDCQVKHRSNA